MRCYVCALDGTEAHAVAICPICAVGLCLGHLDENARRGGPGGSKAFACLHRPGHDRAGPSDLRRSDPA
jgi:hypothetical protein